MDDYILSKSVEIRQTFVNLGECFNIQMQSYQHRNSHYKGKIVSWYVDSIVMEIHIARKTIFILLWVPRTEDLSIRIGRHPW